MSDEVLKEKIDNLEDNVIHKLRNNENQLRFIYDEIKDIQNRIKYIIMGLLGGFALINSGGMEFLKGLI
jgi:formyltetrahydrofolate synthetase